LSNLCVGHFVFSVVKKNIFSAFAFQYIRKWGAVVA
jgi:hypothetical protein